MNLRIWSGTSLLWTVVLLAAVPGCSRHPQAVVTPPPATSAAAPAPAPAPPPPPVETKVAPPVETPAPVELTDVFFDFDKSNIRDDARATLDTDGKLLVTGKDVAVLLEGHCDERGTIEYNLALGQRRAEAVKGYLIQYGVDSTRISTISYGKERPFAQGHDESAWALNRRVHFVKK